MNQFLADTGFGLVSAAAILLAAVGFTLQFSVTDVLNIAFGSQMTLAAFIGYELNVVLGLNVWVALAAVGLAGGMLSVLLSKGMIQPFLRRGTTFFGMVVITIALDLVIEYAVDAIWGPGFFHFNFSQGKAIHFGAMIFSHIQLVTIVIGALAMVGIHLLLKNTKLGKAMRATSADAALARGCGIPTGRIIQAGWFVSGLLGSVAGMLLGMSLGTFSFTLGDQYLIVIIAAVMLGGIGQAYGAMLGALVIGLATQWGTEFISSAYSNVIAFIILVLVLLLRPSGILAGVAKERGVAA
jgi:branched-chain amino acid transport system permease protein/neutral amino acid transport system permease protein